MSQVINVHIKVNEKVVLEKVYSADTSREEITEKMALYIQEEQLTKLGKVILSVSVPAGSYK